MNRLQIAYTTVAQRKKMFEEAYMLAGIRYGLLDDFAVCQIEKYIEGEKELAEVEYDIYHMYEAYGEYKGHGMPLWDNRLGIYKKKILAGANAALATVGIMKLDAEQALDMDIDYYRTVHKKLYGGLYPWAGEIRDIEISKYVDALQRTYRFMKAENVQRGLENISGRLRKVMDRNDIEGALQSVFPKIGVQDWNRMDDREKVAGLVNSIGNMWRIHPFLHGNFFTELYFIVRFCDWLGMPCKRSVLREYSKERRLEQCMILARYDPNGLGRVIYRAVCEYKYQEEKRMQSSHVEEKHSWVQIKEMIADRKKRQLWETSRRCSRRTYGYGEEE